MIVECLSTLTVDRRLGETKVSILFLNISQPSLTTFSGLRFVNTN